MYDDSQIINGCRPMTAGDGRGRKFTVNGHPFRPSPSGLKKDGAEEIWTSEDAMSNHYNTCVHHDGYLGLRRIA